MTHPHSQHPKLFITDPVDFRLALIKRLQQAPAFNRPLVLQTDKHLRELEVTHNFATGVEREIENEATLLGTRMATTAIGNAAKDISEALSTHRGDTKSTRRKIIADALSVDEQDWETSIAQAHGQLLGQSEDGHFQRSVEKTFKRGWQSRVNDVIERVAEDPRLDDVENLVEFLDSYPAIATPTNHAALRKSVEALPNALTRFEAGNATHVLDLRRAAIQQTLADAEENILVNYHNEKWERPGARINECDPNLFAYVYLRDDTGVSPLPAEGSNGIDRILNALKINVRELDPMTKEHDGSVTR